MAEGLARQAPIVAEGLVIPTDITQLTAELAEIIFIA